MRYDFESETVSCIVAAEIPAPLAGSKQGESTSHPAAWLQDRAGLKNRTAEESATRRPADHANANRRDELFTEEEADAFLNRAFQADEAAKAAALSEIQSCEPADVEQYIENFTSALTVKSVRFFSAILRGMQWTTK